MTRRLAFLLPVVLAACTTIDKPTPQNLAQYCTPKNAYFLGSQGHAYFGDCPKDTEAAFLQGLERGRALRPSTPVVEPYYERMAQTEKRLLAASSEAERAQLRVQLRDVEWWTIHLLYNNSSFMSAN